MHFRSVFSLALCQLYEQGGLLRHFQGNILFRRGTSFHCRYGQVSLSLQDLGLHASRLVIDDQAAIFASKDAIHYAIAGVLSCHLIYDILLVVKTDLAVLEGD